MPRHIDISTRPNVSFNNILFATDFSPRSALALGYALAIARKHRSKIYVVHVLPEPPGLPASAREGLEAIGAQPRSDLTRNVDGLRETLATLPHEILCPSGDVWLELSKVVAAKEVGLIVAGTHGRSGVGKLLMGSVAEKIFRRAACPVLAVGPAVSGEAESIVDLHEILFATDLGAASMAALPYAIALAEESSARLYVLHVAEDPVKDADEKMLQERLRNLVPPGTKLASPPRVFVESGPPAERILAIAEELGMDLIVLGAKRSPVYFEATPHLPMATAYKVVSQAICPVLTVVGR
jgi:nucleotide-binding universal stress UspA family protein